MKKEFSDFILKDASGNEYHPAWAEPKEKEGSDPDTEEYIQLVPVYYLPKETAIDDMTLCIGEDTGRIIFLVPLKDVPHQKPSES